MTGHGFSIVDLAGTAAPPGAWAGRREALTRGPPIVRYFLRRLGGTFWLVPTLMIVAAVGLALAMVRLDESGAAQGFHLWSDRLSLGVEGSRQVVATISGAMVTSTSLVYSMTLVALTLAAQSAGQRLLQEFMGHRTMQVSLGLFLATFVYCLIVLRAIVGGENAFVPSLSVAGAILLALASLIWLIYFIHSLAAGIQTHSIVARVAERLGKALLAGARCDGPDASFERPTDPPRPLPIAKAGYVEQVDEAGLLAAAAREQVMLRILVRPGHFLCRGDSVAEWWGAPEATARLQRAVNDAIVTGPRRTAADDAEYLVHLIVEIALRGLSPGINDTYTAIACVDHLMGAFAPVMARGLRGPVRRDALGAVRLELYPSPLESLMAAAIDPIREAGGKNLPVMLRLLENLGRLSAHAADAATRGEIVRQARLAASIALRHTETESDGDEVRSRLAKVRP